MNLRLILPNVLIAISLGGVTTPASAQYSGADPAAIGASTYCAARGEGLDDKQASKRANGSLAAAGDFATLIVHMQSIRSRMIYLAKEKCPEYFGLAPRVEIPAWTPQPSRPIKSETELKKESCSLYESGQANLKETNEKLGLKTVTTAAQVLKFCAYYK